MDKNIEVLSKIIPHLLEPDVFPQAKLSLDDCAEIMSMLKRKQIARNAVAKLECSGLIKLRNALEHRGIRRLSDISG